MRNEIFNDADKLSLPVAADTASGTPVIVGALPGITATAEGEGGNADGYASVWLKGAYTVPVTTAVASVGTPIYLTSGGSLTNVASGNTLWGHALETKSAATAPIRVRIAQV